jgi:hypothetical protein
VANTLELHRNGAVGFIDWLDHFGRNPLITLSDFLKTASTAAAFQSGEPAPAQAAISGKQKEHGKVSPAAP